MNLIFNGRLVLIQGLSPNLFYCAMKIIDNVRLAKEALGNTRMVKRMAAKWNSEVEDSTKDDLRSSPLKTSLKLSGAGILGGVVGSKILRNSKAGAVIGSSIGMGLSVLPTTYKRVKKKVKHLKRSFS